jgi:hypothetical protein
MNYKVLLPELVYIFTTGVTALLQGTHHVCRIPSLLNVAFQCSFRNHKTMQFELPLDMDFGITILSYDLLHTKPGML